MLSDVQDIATGTLLGCFMQMMSYIKPGTSHILQVMLEKLCSSRAELLYKRTAVKELTKITSLNLVIASSDRHLLQ